MSQIYETDSVYETALKIFTEFEVGQSCTIIGLTKIAADDVREKGEMVKEQLEEMDRLENFGTGKRRRGVKLANSIGGHVAQKIFLYKRTVIDNRARWNIWRKQ